MDALVTGSATFAGIGLLALVLSLLSPAASKDRGLTNLLIITATVCCWLMWVITYMMQLHPLVKPIPMAE